MKLTVLILLISTLQVQAQAVNGWEIFSKVRFSSKFFKEYNEYFLVPFFDSGIRLVEGKEVILQGYYMPIDLKDNNVIILSKYPYSQCFFCGGAGPESVAEIVFPTKHPKLNADQIVTVRGFLALNDSDVDHLNFILKQASIVRK